jgi:hypothetical protein
MTPMTLCSGWRPRYVDLPYSRRVAHLQIELCSPTHRERWPINSKKTSVSVFHGFAMNRVCARISGFIAFDGALRTILRTSSVGILAHQAQAHSNALHSLPLAGRGLRWVML